MRVLVTGGAGFIASHICDSLIAEGCQVSIIDDLSSGRLEYINQKARFYCEDICSNRVETVFLKEKPHYLIHHAAQPDVSTSLRDPVRDAQINIMGSINLFNCSVKYEVRKVIMASSAAVYGEPAYLGIDEKHPLNPTSFYGLSKWTCERYLQNYNQLYFLPFTILRYANVYGPRQRSDGEGGVIAVFIERSRCGKALAIYGSGEQTRDFVHVQDIVKANILALTSAPNQIINIGTGNPTSVKQLCHILEKEMGTRLAIRHMAERPGDIKQSFFNISQARSCLNWNPATSLVQGLQSCLSN